MMGNSQSTFVGMKKDRADATSVAQTQVEFDQGGNKWTGGAGAKKKAAVEEQERKGAVTLEAAPDA